MNKIETWFDKFEVDMEDIKIGQDFDFGVKNHT